MNAQSATQKAKPHASWVVTCRVTKVAVKHAENHVGRAVARAAKVGVTLNAAHAAKLTAVRAVKAAAMATVHPVKPTLALLKTQQTMTV